jgi:hypothetical protein
MKPKSRRPFTATDANKIEHRMTSWRHQMRISRPSIRSTMAHSIACGDTRQQWLTPAQAVVTKSFTVSKERALVYNNGILYRRFQNSQ